MSASSSKHVVIAALIGNALIAVTKFAAAMYTGSSAMMSEGIHSLVDTTNQALLLYGIKRAATPADEAHPFGYGREIYFWAFVVAVMIFGVGAGVAIFEGFSKLANPTPIKNAFVNYIVLGLAFVFEAAAWWVAFREFNRKRGTLGYLKAVRVSKDPTVFTVLFEDSAAMLGIVVAFVGIWFAQSTGQLWMDGAASAVIGVILIIVAAILAFECKGLLIGEGATEAVIKNIRALVREHSTEATVNELLTLQLGPQDVLVNMSLDFNSDMTSDDVERLVSQLEDKIKAAHKEVTRVFIEAQSFAGHSRRKPRPEPV
ncbi:MAG: cation diffusion facilitator family transporter [Proteobacteria bacterium]|nr:cation diffusion facilitator family transporter [Pseudomonadota bacterium]